MGVKLFVKALWKHWWAPMSCAIFTAIGIYGAWKEKTNRWYVSASLLAGLLLFLVAAFRAWNEERKGREKAEDALKDETPRMNLEYSDELAKQSWDHSGLVVRDGGKTDGFKIHLASAIPTNGLA